MIPHLSRFAPFILRKYIPLHSPCVDVNHFQSMLIDEELNLVCDTCNGANRQWTADGWVKLWMNWGGRRAILRRDVEAYVHMLFYRCT